MADPNQQPAPINNTHLPSSLPQPSNPPIQTPQPLHVPQATMTQNIPQQNRPLSNNQGPINPLMQTQMPINQNIPQQQQQQHHSSTTPQPQQMNGSNINSQNPQPNGMMQQQMQQMGQMQHQQMNPQLGMPQQHMNIQGHVRATPPPQQQVQQMGQMPQQQQQQQPNPMNTQSNPMNANTQSNPMNTQGMLPVPQQTSIGMHQTQQHPPPQQQQQIQLQPSNPNQPMNNNVTPQQQITSHLPPQSTPAFPDNPSGNPITYPQGPQSGIKLDPGTGSTVPQVNTNGNGGTNAATTLPTPQQSSSGSGAPSGTNNPSGSASGGPHQQSRPPPTWYIQDQHIIDRRKMVTSIAKLLQQRKPNAPTEWMKKLPQMARRLEESLFREATSFDEYKNQDTLKKRLQKLALDMGIRAKASQAANSNSSNAANQGATTGGPAGDGSGNNPQGGNGSGSGSGSGQPNTNGSASQQTPEQRQQVLRQQQQRLLLLRHASKCPHGEIGVSVNDTNHTEGARVVRGKDWKWGDQDGGNTNIGLLGKKRANGWTAVTWDKTRAEREYRIGGEDAYDLQFGGCPVTQHCAGMRTLWKHIAECKDQQCQTPHCVSSRYVLSHYHRCRERSCAVCQPVREAIQRNHEKARDLEARQKQTTGSGSGNKSTPGGPSGNTSGGGKSKKQKNNNNDNGNNNTSGTGSGNSGGGTKRSRPSKAKGKAGSNAGTGNIDNSGGTTHVQQPIVEPLPDNGAGSNAVVALPHKPAVKKTPDPTTSMIYSFSTCQITNHINALSKPVNLKPTAIKSKCGPVLKKLMDAEFGWIFAKPVDPVQLNLPDYFEVIKKPMDLGTCKKKLENGVYREISEFTDDVRLIFDNAISYNGPNSEVTEVAKKLRKTFDLEWKRVQQDMVKEEERDKSKGDMCALCSRGSLQYEPTSYYCNGNGCNGAKIRRNSYYYCDSRNKYHWCPSCFTDLPASIEMADASFEKTELTKKKNDEQFEEPWVGCDGCSRWVHQICALFNGRKNNLDTTVYNCPFCVLADREKLKLTNATVKYKGASEIPHTRASAFLEKRVRNKLATEQRRLIEEDGMLPENVPRPGKLHVRQLSNLKDKCHQVRPRVYERYKDQGFPMEFPVTSKCIVLFEEIEGVDVILFGMYLYEYGHKCPQPNHRRVYVSYLDSVHYFHPRQYRTMVYHEMLVAYLAYAKARGFHTCHIWSCPPFKGDDYIFFCHPEEQKTPKDDRLRNWYMSMLNKCEKEGTVLKLTTLYDEGFKNPDSKVINVPYFEGDHWILEAEAILKAIEDEKETRTVDKGDKKTKGDKKDKKDKKSKNSGQDKKGKRGLRSDGDVEELNGRDPLLVRMGKTLEPMKDAFIVAHLHPPEFAAEKWQQRLREIEAEEKEDTAAAAGGSSSSSDKDGIKNENDTTNMDETAISSKGVGSGGEKTAISSSTSSSSLSSTTTDIGVKAEGGEKDIKPDPSSSADSTAPTDNTVPIAVSDTNKDTNESTLKSDVVVKTENSAFSEISPPSDGVVKSEVKTEAQVPETTSSTVGDIPANTPPTTTTPTTSSAPSIKSETSETKDNNAMDVDTPAAPSSSSSSSSSSTTTDQSEVSKQEQDNKNPFPNADESEYPPYDPPSDELEDQDDQQESEFFDTRQQFLNLCQGNHYQFDQIRRAKHTSMMALYHIHNPDKPKFLTPCSACGVDINSIQYDCEQCPEFHLCHKCMVNFQMQHKSPHPHRLKKVVVQSESGHLTEEQKKQRKRSIELHMQLLAHASTCKNPTCPSANCEKMKNLLAHGTKCSIKIQGGCSVCRRIWALLQIHARQCRRTTCQVPKCRQLKEQLRNIELQQAAMDERRRLAMNEQYSQRPAAEEAK